MRPLSSVAGRSESSATALPAVGVARISTIPALGAVEEQLQPRDRTRLARMASDKRRRELLAGRWLLQTFATELGVRGLLFDSAEGDEGVTVAAANGRDADVAVSVTHAADWIGCAMAQAAPIAVDLEMLSERDFLALAGHAFPHAAPLLNELVPARRKIEFYRRWTQHEARIKSGAAGRRCTAWLLPDEWVLSVCCPSEVANAPTLWSAEHGRFESMPLERLRGSD